MRKPTIWVSDQVRHKPGCTVTEKGKMLEILDLKRRGIVLLCSENEGADQLRSYCEADLRLCLRLFRLLVFPCSGSFIIREVCMLRKVFKMVAQKIRRW